MIRMIGIIAALALAAPAMAQTTAPAQSWPVMGNHTLDMPNQGSHSYSRPWDRVAAAPAKKSAKAKRAR